MKRIVSVVLMLSLLVGNIYCQNNSGTMTKIDYECLHPICIMADDGMLHSQSDINSMPKIAKNEGLSDGVYYASIPKKQNDDIYIIKVDKQVKNTSLAILGGVIVIVGVMCIIDEGAVSQGFKTGVALAGICAGGLLIWRFGRN